MGDGPPFNNPFREAAPELKRRLRQWRREARQERLDRLRQAPEAPKTSAPAESEAVTLAEAMQGVVPLSEEERSRAAPRPRASRPAAREEESEAHARLADLVAGRVHFDITHSPEYVEGLADGVDRRLLRRLKKGEFAQQAHLDLHGLTRDEARGAVERFVQESRVQGRRCVLLVHGRGLGSRDQVPVLKNALVAWLSRGRLGRRVLAFCTARPVDGGAGALYVLLRK